MPALEITQLHTIALETEEPLSKDGSLHFSQQAVKSKRKAFGDQPSNLSDTESETISSSSCNSEDDEANDVSICLLQKRSKRNHLAFLARPRLVFGEELAAVRLDTFRTTIELHNFIERSTRHDILALRDLLLQEDRTWKSVTMSDKPYASNFRRWAYKKENVNHHIQKLCTSRNIQLDYQVHLAVNVDDMSAETAVALLQEVTKHPDIHHLQVVGHLNAAQEEAVLSALTSLVSIQDRKWEAVQIYTGYSGEDLDYESWRVIMEEYMNAFSQLYTQYNLPVDIRPCVVH